MSLFRNKYYLLFFLFYTTLLIGFFMDEDSLGGAKHDYLYHIKFVDLFKDNTLSDGLKKYTNLGYESRNSPLFYIIFAYFNKFVSIDIIRFVNSFISIFLAVIFYKCLELKYQKQSKLILILLSCIIFLSPTVRSLSIWPYPLLWGLFFFISSLYFFLQFLELENNPNKFLFCCLSTILITIAAYIHPPLGLFNIFYLIYFYLNLNFKKILIIITLNILFIIPVIIFLSKNGLFFFNKMEGENVNIFTALNPFNKIIIISTIIFYYLIPCINPFHLFKEIIQKINLNKLLIFLIITLIFSKFFDYSFTSIHGGGYVHKISYILLGNYQILYAIFFISLIVFFVIFNDNFKNYLIYILIIVSNIQYTIYNKYYDILILIVFFLIADLNMKKRFFQNKYNILFLYFFYTAYYLVNLFKGNLYRLF